MKRLLLLLLPAMSLISLATAAPVSLAQFDKKARSGTPVSVVFFGGSLTWGANASDPLTTSYRGRMMQYLRDRYPKTPITFHDAAIGGTGSMLGLYRLQRDVLAKNPDLVFLDFTMNDGADKSEPETLAAYEHLVRSILESGSALQPVITTFKFFVDTPQAPTLPLLDDHLKLAAAYGLPPANIHQAIFDAVQAKEADPEKLWAIDGVHPDDPGYEAFFQVVRDRFEKSIVSGAKPQIPAGTVFEDTYPSVRRQVLVDSPLPPGWTREKTYRTSLWFDGLSSRWMGDVACASAANKPGAIEIGFEGSMVGLFGERSSLTPPVKIWIDGKPVQAPKAKEGDFLWPLDTSLSAPRKKGSGNLFLWQEIARNLPDGKHTLRIEPVWENADKDAELRIGSICSAGH